MAGWFGFGLNLVWGRENKTSYTLDNLSIIVPKLKTTFCIFDGVYNTLWLAGLALVWIWYEEERRSRPPTQLISQKLYKNWRQLCVSFLEVIILFGWLSWHWSDFGMRKRGDPDLLHTIDNLSIMMPKLKTTIFIFSWSL